MWYDCLGLWPYVIRWYICLDNGEVGWLYQIWIHSGSRSIPLVFSFHLVYAYKTSQVLWCFIYTLIQTSNYKTFSYHQIYSPQSSPSDDFYFNWRLCKNFEMHSKSFYIWKSHSNFVLLCIYKQIGIWIDAKRTQFIIL